MKGWYNRKEVGETEEKDINKSLWAYTSELHKQTSKPKKKVLE